MKKKVVQIALTLIATVPAAVSAQQEPTGPDGPEAALIRARSALAALGQAQAGGEADWVSARVSGHVMMLEQSGTLDGGWLRLERSARIALDLAGGRGTVEETRTLPAWEDTPFGQYSIAFDGPLAAARIPAADGPQWREARRSQLREARHYLDLFPRTLLREALDADDLTLVDGDLVFTRQPDGVPETVTIDLDETPGLPTGFTVRTRFPDNIYLSGWGESTLTGRYGFWWRTADGRLLPRQLDVAFNGLPWQRYEISEFSFSDAAPSDDPVPDGELAAPRSLAVDSFPFSNRHEDIAEGVRVYFGAWNVAVVELDDGVYVLDAPISNGYSQALMDQVERDFPDQPIRGVITTSNAWPHMAGVAAYARRGIPVYTHPDGIRQITRMAPDLAGSASLVGTIDGDTLGPEGHGLRIRAARGPGLDRMLFVYIEDRDIAWASDAVQLDQDGITPLAHARQYVAEFLEAVCPDIGEETRVIAMHAGPVGATGLRDAFTGDHAPPCPVTD